MEYRNRKSIKVKDDNGVWSVNSRWFLILVGIIIGLAYPLVIDWMLFGDITPCSTVTVYEDGSSIQACKVRG